MMPAPSTATRFTTGTHPGSTHDGPIVYCRPMWTSSAPLCRLFWRPTTAAASWATPSRASALDARRLGTDRLGDAAPMKPPQSSPSFDDPRITFVNLPRNVGEQSGPNNEGFVWRVAATSRYLNHDDLYFPDHLAASMEYLRADGRGPGLDAGPHRDARDGDESDRGRWAIRLYGCPCDDYEPRTFVFASAWVMTRELADVSAPGGRPRDLRHVIAGLAVPCVALRRPHAAQAGRHRAGRPGG